MDYSLLAGTVSTNIVTSGAYHPWYYRLLRMGMPEYPIKGHLDKDFQYVEKCFKRNFDKGLEIGASVTVYSHGRRVVDLYGGFTDLAMGHAFTEHTLPPVFSTNDVLEAIVIARLVDEGRLSYTSTVASIWPEFGAGEKSRVTVTNVLRHEAGIPYFANKAPSEDISEAEIIAKQVHLYGGSTTRAYHGLSRSWILNEIVQRVDYRNRTLSQIYKQDFNTALDMEFHRSLDPDAEKRRSPWHTYPTFDSILRYAVPRLKTAGGEDDYSTILNGGANYGNITKICETLGPEYEEISLNSSIYIPTSNCFTNSYSLATIGACLANQGSLDGAKLLNSATLDIALGDETESFDLCLFKSTTMTQGGFGVFTFDEIGPEVKFYGWTGFSGSLMLFSPMHNFSFSYATNAQSLPVMIVSRARRLFVSAFKAHLRLS